MYVHAKSQMSSSVNQTVLFVLLVTLLFFKFGLVLHVSY